MILAIGLELGSAAAVDPDASIVPAPGLSLIAGRAATLIDEAHAATGIHAAGLTPTVVGGAVDGAGAVAATPASPVSTVAYCEFSAAPPVNPDSVVIPAPGLSLYAG